MIWLETRVNGRKLHASEWVAQCPPTSHHVRPEMQFEIVDFILNGMTVLHQGMSTKP